jgi:hypothetical protein
VALVLGVGCVAANNLLEGRELDSLLARVDSAQGTIGYSDRRVAATIAYSRPLLFSADTPPNVRTSLQQLVADSAAGQVGAVAKERADAAEVSVLRWHRGLRRAKAALLAYLDVRVAYLRTVAADSRSLYVVHPELAQSMARARTALRDAAGGAQNKRVDAAFGGG